LATVLGSVVTDTKAWLTPDMPGKKRVAKIISQFDAQSNLLVHGMARIAFCELENSSLFFANGFFREISSREFSVALELCVSRKVCAEECGERNVMAFIEWLVTKGVFDPGN
jgi:hypothetical protein